MKNNNIRKAITGFSLLILCLVKPVYAQQAWYIDGYHGGIWGHYPEWNTRFMADMLKKHPDWKINIEIEPETWARAKQVDPAAYADLQALFADRSANGRIEYVNPAYAQSYMYNISGESIIRQLGYGMNMIRQHFPQVVFSTYSTEEPCFTSALPQLLTSFGFNYASLKNPNTCFGGYTRAHGQGLVNWTGPDGTGITTSPRYEVEQLADRSTWQTIAWDNGARYINAAYANGVKHPIGMTLQDAGWKNGPFIGNGSKGTINSTYTTWRNYFQNVAKDDPKPDWKVTQEDILVSLVWGSQVTQRIAQQVRVSENKLTMAEKMAALAKLEHGTAWPQAALDSAWRTLLLSQHHDCWIVPYNGRPGDTWADKVQRWTANTNRICDSILTNATATAAGPRYIGVYNSAAFERQEVIQVPASAVTPGLADPNGKPIAMQKSMDGKSWYLMAHVPAMGHVTFQSTSKPQIFAGKDIIKQIANGTYSLETDLYKIIIDPARGGAINSIVAKQIGNKEIVDKANKRAFNELRGNFYNAGGFRSSVEKPATVEILENGALVGKLLIKGDIAGNPFEQVITVKRGQPRIDVGLTINWKGNTGIGGDTPKGTYKLENPAKAFYDDRNKLLAYFPINIKEQRMYKDAPFDVTESRLDDTFFTRWDSIKNNVILNWVDVTDKKASYGLALFSDHTTSYAHGKTFPLGLDIQYSGMGLWGRNYTLDGPTSLNYALVPHRGDWNTGGVEAERVKWNEPLIVSQTDNKPASTASLLTLPAGYELSALNFDGNDLLIRLYKTALGNAAARLTVACQAEMAAVVELDGRVKEQLHTTYSAGGTSISVNMPQFGVRTIRLVNARQ